MAVRGGLRAGELGVTLIVRDVTVAAEFYRIVLGAREIRRHGSASQLDAVEMKLGDADLVVTRENPRWREAQRPDSPRSPASAGAATSFFTVHVTDVDAVLSRAIAMGASPQARGARPEDVYWGDRVAQFHDPSGHVWRIQTRLEDGEPNDLPARFAAARAPSRGNSAAPSRLNQRPHPEVRAQRASKDAEAGRRQSA
jgi:PhnB protein